MECLSAIRLKPGCPFLFALRRVNRKLKLVQLKLIPVITIPYIKDDGSDQKYDAFHIQLILSNCRPIQ